MTISAVGRLRTGSTQYALQETKSSTSERSSNKQESMRVFVPDWIESSRECPELHGLFATSPLVVGQCVRTKAETRIDQTFDHRPAREIRRLVSSSRLFYQAVAARVRGKVQIRDGPWGWQLREIPTGNGLEISRHSVLVGLDANARDRRRSLRRIVQLREIGKHLAVAVSAVLSQPGQGFISFEVFNLKKQLSQLCRVVAGLEVGIQVVQKPMQLFCALTAWPQADRSRRHASSV